MLPNDIHSAIDKLPLERVQGFVVAFSGGVDSHVLLHSVREWCQLRASVADGDSRCPVPESAPDSVTTAAPDSETNAATDSDPRAATVQVTDPHSPVLPDRLPCRSISLRAHHVDHALQSDSAKWAHHCEAVCRQLQVPFTATRVAVDLGSGRSPEDAARRARYDALSADLQTDEVLLLGHHADDQAETLLLQLLRGAGVNGLAGMPAFSDFGPGYLARPMLQINASAIREYAHAKNLQWVEDPSNNDDSFDRNLLRNQVMPLLKSRWPAVATSVARSASHCAEATIINRTFARGVLGEQIGHRVLSLQVLSALSVVEQKTVLRCWIEHHGYRLPSAGKLSHLLTDLVEARASSAGDITWGDARIRKYQRTLYLGNRHEFTEPGPFRYDWSALTVPLTIKETGQVLTQDDIPDAYRHLPGGLVVCSRIEGAQLKLAGHSMHKAVKKLFQECSIPPWKRSRLPFICAGGNLIGIVGIGFTD